ncbi:hypothetical protein pb186bvf_009171 [Paramecium bursaria]
MDQFYEYGTSFCISAGLKSLVAPIERYRLIRQTQDLLTLQQKEKVFNILQYFKNQQFLSLWRGNITAILIWFPQVFSKLAFYENIKQSAHAPDLIFQSLSTALCGISTLLISYPFETARVRQATEIVYEKRVYSSLKESLYQVRQDSGTYKGLTFGILHTVNFAILINFINNQLKDLTSHSIEIAFLSSSLILYPIETLKHRQQIKSIFFHQEASKQANFMDKIKKQFKDINVRSLYGGISAHIVKNLLLFSSLELIQYSKLPSLELKQQSALH